MKWNELLREERDYKWVLNIKDEVYECRKIDLEEPSGVGEVIEDVPYSVRSWFLRRLRQDEQARESGIAGIDLDQAKRSLMAAQALVMDFEESMGVLPTEELDMVEHARDTQGVDVMNTPGWPDDDRRPLTGPGSLGEPVDLEVQGRDQGIAAGMHAGVRDVVARARKKAEEKLL